MDLVVLKAELDTFWRRYEQTGAGIASILAAARSLIREVERLQSIETICLERAREWDHAHTTKMNEAAPSEYLVWRGRALEANAIAELF